ADFEAALAGVRPGRPVQFPVRFPDDYGLARLAGRQVEFQVYPHLVLEPVAVDSLAALAAFSRRNLYRFTDLVSLREHNENLCYLVLRETALRGLTQDMTDFFSLMSYYLRLGFRERVEEMLPLLPGDPDSRLHAGRLFLAAGLHEQALALLPSPGQGDAMALIQRIKALIHLERLAEAETLAADPRLAVDVQGLDLRVGLATLQGLPTSTLLARLDALIDRQVEAMRRGISCRGAGGLA
ncbi:MAG: hypothetical protein AB1634_15225, partial [Thermodesulfobacteriota bacterium]